LRRSRQSNSATGLDYSGPHNCATNGQMEGGQASNNPDQRACREDLHSPQSFSVLVLCAVLLPTCGFGSHAWLSACGRAASLSRPQRRTSPSWSSSPRRASTPTTWECASSGAPSATSRTAATLRFSCESHGCVCVCVGGGVAQCAVIRSKEVHVIIQARSSQPVHVSTNPLQLHGPRGRSRRRVFRVRKAELPERSRYALHMAPGHDHQPRHHKALRRYHRRERVRRPSLLVADPPS